MAKQPYTPEGAAAARKVKNLFMLILAANLALIAIIFFPKLFKPVPEPPPPQPVVEKPAP